MQTDSGNTGNTGNTNQGGSSLPFVQLFEKAIVQYVVLEKAKQGEITKDNVKSIFKGNLQLTDKTNVENVVRELVSNGHLKEQNNKYTITDDGREDIQKVEGFIPELQQYVSKGGMQGTQGQRQGQGPTQQNVAGGMGGTTTGTGSVGSGSNPNQGRQPSTGQNR